MWILRILLRFEPVGESTLEAREPLELSLNWIWWTLDGAPTCFRTSSTRYDWDMLAWFVRYRRQLPEYSQELVATSHVPSLRTKTPIFHHIFSNSDLNHSSR